MVVFGEWAQVEAVELVNDGSGLAFGIVGGRSSGVIVKTILPGGVADRDGRLRSGDRILRIGGVRAVGMCARQAAAVLRQCGQRVRLLVARAADTTEHTSLGASQAPIVPSRLLADPDELERHLAEQGYAPEFYTEDPYDIRGHGAVEGQTMIPVTSIVAIVPNPLASLPAVQYPISVPRIVEDKLPLDMALRSDLPETELFEVNLAKDCKYGLGITVAGYVCEQEELSGIFVKSISEGSSADLSKKIQVNDRIIEVDGKALRGVSNHAAVALLRHAQGKSVKLKLERYLRGARYEKLQRAIKAQGDKRMDKIDPPSPSVTSLPKCAFSMYEESTVIEADIESHVEKEDFVIQTPDNIEIVIGGSEDNVNLSSEVREIQDKWREILINDPDWPGYEGDDFQIAVGNIDRGEGGLGVSLSGTSRIVGGQELCARHFIRALAPGGALARAGIFCGNDELLEVNGSRLLGAHHSKVVNILRTLPSQVNLICCRRLNTALHNNRTRAAFDIKTILGGSLQSLLLQPPQSKLTKAKSESSLNSHGLASPSSHHQDDIEKQKSRSLEQLSGLAMWSDKIVYIDLIKTDRGLGFSILDYLDPSEPGSTVIVVRALVSGGAAASDGRLSPGDRLLSVNGNNVSKASLAVAVQALKGAPKGTVRIGVAKPLPSSSLCSAEKVADESISSQRREILFKMRKLLMSLERDVRSLNIRYEAATVSISKRMARKRKKIYRDMF